MRVLEDRIVNAFMDFMEGVKGSSLVMAREETIQFVEGKVEEHKKRGAAGAGEMAIQTAAAAPLPPQKPPLHCLRN